MVRLRVVGFVSARCGHEHLLKHVLRLTELEALRSRPAQDDEQWSSLLADPPLIADPERRRARALEVLANVPGCVAGEVGPTSGQPCKACQNRGAIAVVTREMKALLEGYEQVAQASLDRCFAQPDRRGPRLVAYRTPQSPVVETIDERHVRVVGALGPDGQVSLVTCYRDRSRPLRSAWLALARLRASHKQAGTLVSVV